jgi:hypothetical protein
MTSRCTTALLHGSVKQAPKCLLSTAPVPCTHPSSCSCLYRSHIITRRVTVPMQGWQKLDVKAAARSCHHLRRSSNTSAGKQASRQAETCAHHHLFFLNQAPEPTGTMQVLAGMHRTAGRPTSLSQRRMLCNVHLELPNCEASLAP